MSFATTVSTRKKNSAASTTITNTIAVVTPVYSAGEAPIPGIDRDELAAGLRRHGHPNVLTVDDEAALVEAIASVAKSGDLVVGLGAGTITDWINALPKNLERRGGRA